MAGNGGSLRAGQRPGDPPAGGGGGAAERPAADRDDPFRGCAGCRAALFQFGAGPGKRRRNPRALRQGPPCTVRRVCAAWFAAAARETCGRRRGLHGRCGTAHARSAGRAAGRPADLLRSDLSRCGHGTRPASGLAAQPDE